MADDEELPEERAIGPKCDVCGKSTESLYPLLVKRERRGMLEMVQIYLCSFHFMERMEEDMTPPPPEDEEKSAEDLWSEMLNPPEEEEEDEDEDNDGGWSSTTVDRIGQSFG